VTGTTNHIMARLNTGRPPGATIAVRPSTARTLKMLLPTAMSASPLSAGDTEMAISGEFVPKAKTVRPITSGEMPKPATTR